MEEAFDAMVNFLQAYYDRTHSDDVGSILGDTMLLGDGQTADPAALDDWKAAVEKALARG